MKILEFIDREQNKDLTSELMKCQEVINDQHTHIEQLKGKLKSSKELIRNLEVTHDDNKIKGMLDMLLDCKSMPQMIKLAKHLKKEL